DHLLLVSARQRPRGAVDISWADVERTDVFARRLAFGGALDESGAGESGERREADVAVDRLVEQQPLRLAFLGSQPDTGGHGGADRPGAQLVPGHGHRPGGRFT